MSTAPPKLALNLAADSDTDIAPAWKQELSERLAATRSRRSRKPEEQGTLKGLDHFETKTESRAARLAAKVAERYANAPSYSDILAGEARAAAAIAALSALQAGQEKRDETPAEVSAGPSEVPALPAAPTSLPLREPWNECVVSSASFPSELVDMDPAPDQELEVGLDPCAEAFVSPAQPLAVNLIEFPRELVAARKARPRLAEGPLRQTAEEAEHDHTQLRIFEVASESISKEGKTDASPAGWSSIRLDANPLSASFAAAQSASQDGVLKTAPLEDRLMAGIVDLALVLAAFALFILVFAACTAHPPTGKPAWFGAGLALAALFLLYQFLFFRFGTGTPGMRYAKIALCTFDDENPSREEALRRIPSLLLSAAPLGLGFAWAWFDGDRLGWHDRLTRMYQRSYS